MKHTLMFCICIIETWGPRSPVSQRITAASPPPPLSNFTYDVSRQTRFPRDPVVSRDTLKEGTEVELLCCQSRASHSHLHEARGRVKTSGVETVKAVSVSYQFLNIWLYLEIWIKIAFRDYYKCHLCQRHNRCHSVTITTSNLRLTPLTPAAQQHFIWRSVLNLNFFNKSNL